MALLGVGIPSAMSSVSLADESGTSFWLPGTYGSLAAVPGYVDLLTCLQEQQLARKLPKECLARDRVVASAARPDVAVLLACLGYPDRRGRSWQPVRRIEAPWRRLRPHG